MRRDDWSYRDNSRPKAIGIHELHGTLIDGVLLVNLLNDRVCLCVVSLHDLGGNLLIRI